MDLAFECVVVFLIVWMQSGQMGGTCVDSPCRMCHRGVAYGALLPPRVYIATKKWGIRVYS